MGKTNECLINNGWKSVSGIGHFFSGFSFNCATFEVVFVKKFSSTFDNLMNNSELCTGAEYWMMILWKEGGGTALPQAFKNMMTSFCQGIIHYNAPTAVKPHVYLVLVMALQQRPKFYIGNLVVQPEICWCQSSCQISITKCSWIVLNKVWRATVLGILRGSRTFLFLPGPFEPTRQVLVVFLCTVTDL